MDDLPMDWIVWPYDQLVEVCAPTVESLYQNQRNGAQP